MVAVGWITHFLWAFCSSSHFLTSLLLFLALSKYTACSLPQDMLLDGRKEGQHWEVSYNRLAQALESAGPRFGFWLHHLLAEWCWENYWTCECLHFLICNMGLIIPTLQDCKILNKAVPLTSLALVIVRYWHLRVSFRSFSGPCYEWGQWGSGKVS